VRRSLPCWWSLGNFKRAVVFPDMHLPWVDVKTLQLGLRLVKSMRPDLVIQLGDLTDNYCFSRFPKSMDVITPKAELKKAREMGELFWSEVHSKAPKAKRVQLRGNHEAERLQKAALLLAPTLYSIVEKEARALSIFDGVETTDGYRSTFKTTVQGEPVEFLHGILSTTLAHVQHYQTNIVMGHLHKAELVHSNGFWGLNAGFLGDPDSVVFNYTRTLKTGWTSGIAVVDELGPRFISKRSLERTCKGK
jgi:predicted phosphodiesterase